VENVPYGAGSEGICPLAVWTGVPTEGTSCDSKHLLNKSFSALTKARVEA